MKDFPGGPVVKNPPCNAGDAGSIPGQETKVPHAVDQLSTLHCDYWAHPLWVHVPHTTREYVLQRKIPPDTTKILLQLTPSTARWVSRLVGVQSLSNANSVTLWIAAHQASQSFIVSWSLLKLKSIESVMPSSHLILVVPFSSCLQSFPASGSFLMSQFFASSGQSTGVSASASVLPMNIQGWFL